MKARITVASALLMGLFAANGALAEKAPTVVSSYPATGAQQVSPDLGELTVTFSKAMRRHGYSIMPVGCGRFPRLTGRPVFISPTTVRIPVKLEPGTQYCVGLNAHWHIGFQSVEGVPAMPHVISFRTAASPGRTGGRTPFKRPVRREMDVETLVRVSVPATVFIRTDRGLGSGFIVHENGFIVTNHHVVRGARWITVRIRIDRGHRNYLAKVINRNTEQDLAVLKINPERKLNPISLGDSSAINVGERVIAIGNPVGLETTVTEGIVSAVRSIRGHLYIQTSAAINPGNSGGALINKYGEVIGVNAWIMRRHRRKRIALEGLNFAVPINHVKPLLSAALKSAPRRMFAGLANFSLPKGRGKAGLLIRRQFSGSARVPIKPLRRVRVIPGNMPIMGEVRFCRGVTVSGDPIGAATTFPAGTGRVTALFKFRNFKKHTPFMVAWYRNGALVRARRRLWRLGRAGFFQDRVDARKGRSLAGGLWRFEFTLGRRMLTRAVFTVQGGQTWQGGK
jgi:S1-C subfamily serine protease